MMAPRSRAAIFPRLLLSSLIPRNESTTIPTNFAEQSHGSSPSPPSLVESSFKTENYNHSIAKFVLMDENASSQTVPILERDYLMLQSHRRRSRRSVDDDSPPPTIPTEICSVSVQEFESLNNALYDALTQLTDSSASTTCSNYKGPSPQQAPGSAVKCTDLIIYIQTTATGIACESMKLKQMGIASNSNYLAMEAKYEKKVGYLKKVIDDLKRSHAQVQSRLKVAYTQTLQLFQLRINQLEEENKTLKKTIQAKMLDIVVGRIESANFTEAEAEYRRMQVSRDESIPTILRRVYRSRDDGRVVALVGNFIKALPAMEEHVVAFNALYDLMKDKGDLGSPSIFVLYDCIDYIATQSNFERMFEHLKTVTNTLKGKVRPYVESVISTMAANIRRGDYAQVVSFSSGKHSSKYFIPHAEAIMRASFVGLSSLDQILPFLRTMPRADTCAACGKGLVMRMKEGGYIYSRGGLELVYTLYMWPNVVSDSALVKEIPASLKLFGEPKGCSLHNVDKGSEFLGATEIRHWGDRRLVFTWPRSWKITDDAKWVIRSADWGKTFTLLNYHYREYLYAASDPYKYDKYRRSVYTWGPGVYEEDGIWELSPGTLGYFKIKNTLSGEQLYAATDGYKYSKNWRYVFTWGITSQYYRDQDWTILC